MAEPTELGVIGIVSIPTDDRKDAELSSTPPDDRRSIVSGLPETELRPILRERHVNMIAFSVCVGVGLFLQSGKVIYIAGPGLAVFAYLISGSLMWSTMGSLGEMTALFPVQGGLFVFPRRFLDEGVGYAIGWMTWFSWVVVIASEVLAVAQLWNFRFTSTYLEDVGYPDSSLGWGVGQSTSPAVWVSLFLILILGINCLPVIWYGRLEYIFGCIKMVFIVGLILSNIVINALQRVSHPPNGRFWTYDQPYSFSAQNITLRVGADGQDEVLGGSAGRFLALWTAMTTVVFSLIGFETVSITAAENLDLRTTETIKMGTRKISLRIILLYSLAVFVVGLNVPYTDPNLRDYTINDIRSGENSVFIIALVRNHIRGWPNLLNGVFIFSATTSGINSLYLSSRILHALASIPEVWPQFYLAQQVKAKLERTTWGVPHRAVFVSWLFGFLAFLATKPFPAIELGRMATNSVVSMLIVYAVVCASYLEFYKCIDNAARGRDNAINDTQTTRTPYDRRRSRYPYKSWGQRGKAMYGLVGCSLLAFFNGWRAFVTPFSLPDFIASYISLVGFAILVMAYHVMIDDTWNPLRWRRSCNRELQRPPPVVVSLENRKGTLRWTSEETASFKDNCAALAAWIWAWLK